VRNEQTFQGAFVIPSEKDGRADGFSSLDVGVRRFIDRWGAAVLVSIDRDGWRCGNPLGVESPGLMTGLAGIGYGLLRIAEPTLVPSALALQPPAHSGPTRERSRGGPGSRAQARGPAGE
jgi:hypothetical protein